jgi:hypothetical protein
MVPKDPNALLTRSQTADALTEAGFQTAKSTLATWASRGNDGPEYELYGPRPLYRWGKTLAWAQRRLKPPRRNTSASGHSPMAPSIHEEASESGNDSRRYSSETDVA